MLRADSAQVNWDGHKKQWTVRVQVGEEVIRRPIPNTPESAGEETLRSLAVETVHDDGYEVDPTMVSIVHDA